MSVAICPGSFDPITLGHLNIIRRASKIFDQVVVCVMINAAKSSTMFTVPERVEMVRKAISRFPNVTVDSWDGLLTDYAKKFDRVVVVKGLRAASDFEYEFQMNQINKHLNTDMETLYLPSSEKYTFLSSSIVREIAHYGADLTGLVPNEIIADIQAKAEQRRKTNG